MKSLRQLVCLTIACCTALALLGVAQQRPAVFTPPDDLEFRRANIFSEGTRMSAEVFSMKSIAGKALPTVLMAHGWGGTAAQLRTVAIDFAHAGYFVVTFDYRGWGESDSRLILTGPAPKEKTNNRFTAEVQEVREVVDPLDMCTDWLNAMHWLQGEPQCNKDRIGIWGSSYSGGHVVYVAARDPRVKALVSRPKRSITISTTKLMARNRKNVCKSNSSYSRYLGRASNREACRRAMRVD